ncbi:MAG: hypothetical protein HY043_22840 [Verrucomicrobia bacterium]|nr:hypothetical protein [Verrucomicrobiota bacterium]
MKPKLKNSESINTAEQRPNGAFAIAAETLRESSSDLGDVKFSEFMSFGFNSGSNF